MNIYDEALNCLNELGQETNDEFEGYIIDCYEDWYYKITKALERAKKVEELLGLYKQWIDMAYSPFEREKIWYKIENKLKKLEEMK